MLRRRRRVTPSSSDSSSSSDSNTNTDSWSTFTNWKDIEAVYDDIGFFIPNGNEENKHLPCQYERLDRVISVYGHARVRQWLTRKCLLFLYNEGKALTGDTSLMPIENVAGNTTEDGGPFGIMVHDRPGSRNVFSSVVEV